MERVKALSTHKRRPPLSALLVLAFFLLSLSSCSYTSVSDREKKRIAEGSYAVYWKNKKSAFQCQVKGIYDYDSAVALAARRQALKPENEYWVEKVR